jgi:hypothetical protein
MGGVGCAAPPTSRFPDGEAALQRMHATVGCSRGLSGEVKVDYFGPDGRVRGKLLYLAVLPEELRLDVLTPFGVVLSTLTSDGKNFSLNDLRSEKFLKGPAKACNLRRFTHVPLPAFALVQLLRGEAPVLVHTPDQVSVRWRKPLFGQAHYLVRVESRHGARQEIELVPVPEDWKKPYAEQRVRVVAVRVFQAGVQLYSVDLRGHAVARTAEPVVDPDGLSPTVFPSGPECRSEVPDRVRFRVPTSRQEILFDQVRVRHNPPVTPASFRQSVPEGVEVVYADCVEP